MRRVQQPDLPERGLDQLAVRADEDGVVAQTVAAETMNRDVVDVLGVPVMVVPVEDGAHTGAPDDGVDAAL